METYFDVPVLSLTVYTPESVILWPLLVIVSFELSLWQFFNVKEAQDFWKSKAKFKCLLSKGFMSTTKVDTHSKLQNGKYKGSSSYNLFNTKT